MKLFSSPRMSSKRKHRGRWPLQPAVSCALIKGCLWWHFWLGISSIFQAWRDLPAAVKPGLLPAAVELQPVRSWVSAISGLMRTRMTQSFDGIVGPWMVMEKSECTPETWDSHTIKPLSFAQHSQRLKLKSCWLSAVKEGQEMGQKARTEIKPSPPAGQGMTSSFSVSAHLPGTKL